MKKLFILLGTLFLLSVGAYAQKGKQASLASARLWMGMLRTMRISVLLWGINFK